MNEPEKEQVRELLGQLNCAYAIGTVEEFKFYLEGLYDIRESLTELEPRPMKIPDNPQPPSKPVLLVVNETPLKPQFDLFEEIK